MIGIYKIENKITHEVYIGQSIKIEQRWKQHQNNVKYKNFVPTNKLYSNMDKYGIKNFEFSIIEECSQEKLNEREIYWISYYNSYHNGYNMTPGGSDPCLDRTPIFKAWDQGCSVTQIADITGISKTTIRQSLHGYKNYSEEESRRRGGVVAHQTKLENLGLETNLKVFQYDLDGKFLKEWETESEASKALNILIGSIGACLSNKRSSAGGYQWSREKVDNIGPIKTNWSKKQVAQVDLQTGEIIKIYPTIKAAADALGLKDTSNISKVCKGKRNMVKGYGWKYI